jgi:hypothetical protein
MGNGGINFLQEYSVITITYNNIVTNNSNFTATTGWLGVNSVLSVSSGKLLVTSNGTSSSAYGFFSNATAYLLGKMIYIRLKFNMTNAVCSSVSIRASASGMTAQTGVLQLTPNNGEVYTKSAILTLVAGGSGNVTIQAFHSYADAATANNKVLEITEIMAVDMTTDGLTSYSQAQMDALAFKT